MSERVVSKGPAYGFGPHECVVVGPDDDRESLIAKGLKPEAADEVLLFGEYLKAKAAGETRGWKAWKAER